MLTFSLLSDKNPCVLLHFSHRNESGFCDIAYFASEIHTLEATSTSGRPPGSLGVSKPTRAPNGHREPSRKAKKIDVKPDVFQRMLVSPRESEFWRQQKNSKTSIYPCILPGSGRIAPKHELRKNTENVENVLCFTALDAIPQTQKEHRLSCRNAITTVFCRCKCEFSASENSAGKHVMCVSYCVLRYRMRP